MKWFLFFMAVTVAGCSAPEVSTKENGKKESAVIPATDTTTIPVALRAGDSIHLSKERDSFYAIPPMLRFTGTENTDAFTQLVAAFLNTGRLKQNDKSFSDTTFYRYNNKERPVGKTHYCSNRQYNIKLVTTDLEGSKPKQLYINNKLLRPGRDIDMQFAGNYLLEFLELRHEQIRELSIGSRKFLYIAGGMENCNGNGCGLSFHIIYDIALHKAVAIEQYRINGFFMGADRHDNSLSFLCFEPGDYNYRLNYFPYAASLYKFSEGKTSAIKNKKGKPIYFDGYGVEDTISILKAEQFW